MCYNGEDKQLRILMMWSVIPCLSGEGGSNAEGMGLGDIPDVDMVWQKVVVKPEACGHFTHL